ncbi:MAG: hypothetical protein KDJ65_37720, partial [Anaerolineae bacterium]|nr:hypothetical protein [Anaerolineae bacterium]
MKKRLFTAKQMRWWLAALLLTALFGGLGQIQVILANGYYPTATPMITATYTPTATATRVLEACQVTAVIFDQETYTQGDVMEITVRVANALGNPLAGAKVVADVTRRDLDEVEAEATTGFGLIDRTGDYDGTYAQTDLAGYYDFKFTVSDPTGERFLPCMGTATKTVSPKPTVEPTVEPTIEPTVEPTTEPTVEPTVEPTTEPTVEPTVEPTTEPTIEPTTEPTVEPPLTLIEVAPDSIETTLCRLQETVAVNVGNVT